MATSPRTSSPSLITTWPCLRLHGKGSDQKVIIDLSVSPNAKRTELVGWHDGALRLRLAAVPVDGAANEALKRWLSDELGLPQARIELLRGASGQRKQWALDIPPERIESWLIEQVRMGKLTPPATL